MKIDYKLLREVCLSPIDSFESLGDVYDTPDGIYIFKDNGASVLAVAHLDTVLTMNHFHKFEVNRDTVVLNAQLDDRLGAYTLIHLLPSLGLKYDLLLTEGEEQGRSTAAHFETDKKYNWMFSFDRRGEDVVLYQYESKAIKKSLEASKFKVGQGTFSDIAFLDHLGCKGFNVGTGYHGEHSDMSYANMSEYKRQIRRFESFFKANEGKHFKHDQSKASRFADYRYTWQDYKGGYNYNSRFDYSKDSCELCVVGKGTYAVQGARLCESCLGHAIRCVSCLAVFYDDEIVNGLCWQCEKDIRDKIQE